MLIACAMVAIASPVTVSGAVPAHSGVIIKPHDPVRVIVDAGAVRIERSAVAIQAARSGQMLFVVTDDGTVFSVRATTP